MGLLLKVVEVGVEVTTTGAGAGSSTGGVGLILEGGSLTMMRGGEWMGEGAGREMRSSSKGGRDWGARVEANDEEEVVD